MSNPRRDGRPVGLRDHRSGPAFEQWKIERQAEIDAEKAAQDAAAAQNPTAIYAATANAEAEATRQLVLTGRLSDTISSATRAFASGLTSSCAPAEICVRQTQPHSCWFD